MIARIWHGWTRHENADPYETLLVTTVLPDIAAMGIPGYRGADLMRRVGGGDAPGSMKPPGGEQDVEFVTVLWFDSLADVQAFVGADYEVAHVPDEARALLKRFDARSQHYSVVRGRDPV